ncbi:hypothetical protein [Altererythrobacter sp. ZODW24]|uniref:hypothetical protein n=1 Tax=Altererythrobacter sp. ZODW24 TaxID=2185142 RepID=UPI0013B400DE|nr:hypothetical protein [Altererythrobacter sp. ZODW24]
MALRNLTAAAAALTLIAAPAAAQSVSAERSAEPVVSQSQLGGSSNRLLAVAVLAFGVAVLFLTDKNDDEPVSA